MLEGTGDLHTLHFMSGWYITSTSDAQLNTRHEGFTSRRRSTSNITSEAVYGGEDEPRQKVSRSVVGEMEMGRFFPCVHCLRC